MGIQVLKQADDWSLSNRLVILCYEIKIDDQRKWCNNHSPPSAWSNNPSGLSSTSSDRQELKQPLWPPLFMGIWSTFSFEWREWPLGWSRDPWPLRLRPARTGGEKLLRALGVNCIEKRKRWIHHLCHGQRVSLTPLFPWRRRPWATSTWDTLLGKQPISLFIYLALGLIK